MCLHTTAHVNKMPPQKNSGNRGSKKESGVSAKNRRFIQAFLDDVRKEGKVSDVYVARVLKKVGNGRVEVFYMDSKGKPQMTQTVIRGSFRGKGKHAVWIETGSIVVVADSGIGGSAEFEIMAVLSSDQVRDLSKEMDIDPRILAIDNTDEKALMSGAALDEGGYVFDASDTKEDRDEEFLRSEDPNSARPRPNLERHIEIDDI